MGQGRYALPRSACPTPPPAVVGGCPIVLGKPLAHRIAGGAVLIPLGGSFQSTKRQPKLCVLPVLSTRGKSQLSA
jgi:hypothetical protein